MSEYVVLTYQCININYDLSLKIAWSYSMTATNMMLIYDFQYKVVILCFDFKNCFNLALGADLKHEADFIKFFFFIM